MVAIIIDQVSVWPKKRFVGWNMAHGSDVMENGREGASKIGSFTKTAKLA